MPRPRKCRRVCCMPKYNEFIAPQTHCESKEPIILSVDEYEAIRLIDKEGYSQEECSAYMNVARTTVQQIYTSARRKLATVLVDGCPLKIEGGNYQLCDGDDVCCGCRKKHCHNQGGNEDESNDSRR